MLLLTVALAAPPDVDPAWQAWEAAVELSPAGPPACLRGVVEALERAPLSRAQRAAFEAEAPPWRSAVAPPVPGDTCWGQQGDQRVLTPHFSVEADAGVSQAHIEAFAEALEQAWEVLVDDLGWQPPPGSDTHRVLAYINNGEGNGAYTTARTCASGGWMPYIVTWDSVFELEGYETWYQDMAAHEFNHAQQYGYGFGHESWWWEGTATWLTEQVHPEHDAWSYYVQAGYSAQPWIGMRRSSQQDPAVFLHMYGMAIWGFHLEEREGGHDLVQQTWDAIVGHDGQHDVAMDALLEDLGVDFRASWADFIAGNTVFDYRDQAGFGALTLAQEVDALPAESTHGRAVAPEVLGQLYVRFDADLGSEETPGLRVRFEGDDRADWMALLVGTRGGEVLEVVALELEDGRGEATLDRLANFDDAWLVASPLSGGAGGLSLSWTAEAVEGPPADDPATDDTGTDAEDPEWTPNEGDGPFRPPTGRCASAPGAGAAGLVLAAALLALRRRRPTC